MKDEKENSKNVLFEELIEEGVETFLSQLQRPVQVYCIVSDSVKDMHLALNPPDDFARMNI